MENRKCDCELCVRLRDWKNRCIPDDIIDYILDLEMDIDYWRFLKSGKNPQGKEILEGYLKNYE